MRRPSATGPHRDEIASDLAADRGWVEDRGAASEVLNERELRRYSRNRDYFARVDPRRQAHPYALQEKLKASSVAVLGLGGTGSAVSRTPSRGRPSRPATP